MVATKIKVAVTIFQTNMMLKLCQTTAMIFYRGLFTSIFHPISPVGVNNRKSGGIHKEFQSSGSVTTVYKLFVET